MEGSSRGEEEENALTYVGAALIAYTYRELIVYKWELPKRLSIPQYPFSGASNTINSGASLSKEISRRRRGTQPADIGAMMGQIERNFVIWIT